MPHISLKFIELFHEILKKIHIWEQLEFSASELFKYSLNKAPDYKWFHGAILTKLKKQY